MYGVECQRILASEGGGAGGGDGDYVGLFLLPLCGEGRGRRRIRRGLDLGKSIHQRLGAPFAYVRVVNTQFL